jgi:hypothetical protein
MFFINSLKKYLGTLNFLILFYLRRRRTGRSSKAVRVALRDERAAATGYTGPSGQPHRKLAFTWSAQRGYTAGRYQIISCVHEIKILSGYMYEQCDL